MRKSLALLLILMFPVSVAAAGGRQSGDEDAKTASESREVKTRVRLGDIHVGAGFGYATGYGYGPWPWCGSCYGPLFYDPFFPYLPTMPIHPLPGKGDRVGRIKLKDLPADAKVFIDGGFAGEGSDLKSFYLEPGVYNLSVERKGQTRFEKKLYVLSGKTLQIDVPFESGVTP